MNNAQLTKRRWIVLIASSLVNLCIGALNAWSVFAGPAANHLTGILGHHVTAADLAIVFSVGNGLNFLTMIGGGFLSQRIGPKWVIFLGGVLFGVGFVICGFARNIAMLVVGFGLFSGLAMGLAYGCTMSNSVRFFPDRAGFAGGVGTAAYGISSVILPPIANVLINSFGISMTFIILGVVFIIIVGVSSQFIIKCPDGFVPEGYRPRQSERKTKSSKAAVNMNWKQMLSSMVFYVMITMFFCGTIQGMMTFSQASSMAQSLVRMSVGSAAVVVSALSLSNTIGCILCGSISDKIGCDKTLMGIFALFIASMGLLYINGGGSQALFVIGICLVGLGFGAVMGIYAGFTTERFGAKHSNVNYGIMFIGYNLSGLIGPMIVSGLLNSTGSYRASFLAALAFAVAGLALTFIYRAVNRKARN